MKKINLFLIINLCVSFLFAEKITFSANSMTGSAKSENTDTKLTGEAYIHTESMEIFSDNINLSGDDYKFISAAGNVKGKNFDSGLEFTCENLEYNRDTKVAVLRGNVDLLDTENSVSAKAQIIEYNSNTDIAILQIDINLRQKDNVCTGAYAIYHKKEQMLELSGNAQIKQKEDTFRAQNITLNMDTEEITLDGKVKGTVTEKFEEKKSEAEKTPEANSAENKEGVVSENETDSAESETKEEEGVKIDE